MTLFEAFPPFTMAVPATSANMGPGFDTLGMAVGLYNQFTVSSATADSLTYAANSQQNTDTLSTQPAENLFFQAMDAYCAQHPNLIRPPVHVQIEANIPLSRGLGSSSSVIVAGLKAASVLLKRQDTPEALLPLATALEGHPDNVAPALLGGVRLCVGANTYSLPWPPNWRVLFVIPPNFLSTHSARQVMPAQYPIGDAVANLSACALLVHALHTSDEVAMAQALTDRLHQPYRIPLIPAFDSVAQVAKAHGAMGTVISGAGSAMAVFVQEHQLNQTLLALGEWAVTHQHVGYKVIDLPVLI